MSKLTYGLGFALGTVTREFLSVVKKTSAASTACLLYTSDAADE